MKNFVVKKVGEGAYKVEHRFTGQTKAERTSHAEAQSLADRLNREAQRGGLHPQAIAREQGS